MDQSQKILLSALRTLGMNTRKSTLSSNKPRLAHFYFSADDEEKFSPADLLNFEKLVDYAGNRGLDLEIQNGGAGHARYLIKSIFERTVRLALGGSYADYVPLVDCYTGELTPTVGAREVYAWEPLRRSIVEYLKVPSSRLRILIQNWGETDIETHPLVEHLRSDQESLNGEVMIFSGAGRLSSGSHSEHFLVAGDSYRKEIDRINFKAVGNFCDPVVSDQLRERFEELLDQAGCSSAPILSIPGKQ